ncbi:MAG TPA: hypothetical protein VHL52_05945 [Acidimicrobiia bacterium]|nr:hypothetical protein [Acidimicrobiia bacterium]
MGRFIRRMLMGAAMVWGAKALQDKRREWSMRPADEIRRDVMSKLPDTMDSDSKQKVADKVVQAVKGDRTSRNYESPTPSSTTATPPPETPVGTPSHASPPPPPPPTTP